MIFLHLEKVMPHSSAPNILPGNAIKLPRPSRLRSRLAQKATPTPYQGPSSTAHRMLTMCCTGAHLLAKTGKEKRLPTTATAQKMPAMDNLRMFVFFIMTTP